MIVKIKEAGWEGYNSDLGTVPFKDGVSTRALSHCEAMRLGAFIHIVELDEDGKELGQISPALEVLKSTRITATTTAGTTRITEGATATVEVENLTDKENTDVVVAKRVQAAQEAAGRAAADQMAAASHVKIYTAEELQGIATDKGIAGLREVAAPYGVKNTSVRGLMDEIMVAQAKVK